jgi:hypothetical protein
VKTAVSIPDDLFEQAERAAKETGRTRSGLYAEALRRFLRTMPDEEITARLNAVYAKDPDEGLDPGLQALMYASLSDDDWPQEDWGDDVTANAGDPAR